MTYARTASIVAIVLATATGAWALALPRNSVRSRSIVNGQVKTRDLGRGAVTGSRIADNSLTPATLGSGAAQPGPKGQPGGEGPQGSTGGPGPSAVDRLRLGLAHPVDVPSGPGGRATVPLDPAAYEAEPGAMAIVNATVTVALTSGSCAGTVGLQLAFVVGDFTVSGDFATTSGDLVLTSLGVVEGGAEPVPIRIEALNSCSGTWHLSVARVDVVHVN